MAAARKKYSFNELMRQQNLEANRKVYAFYSNKENLEKVSERLQEKDDSLLKSLLESAQRTIAGIEPPLMLDPDAIVYSIHKPAIEEELKSEEYNGITIDKLLSAFPSGYVINELHRIDNNGVDEETGDKLPSDYHADTFAAFMYNAYISLFKGKVFDLIEAESKNPVYDGVDASELMDTLPFSDIVDIARRENARTAAELAADLLTEAFRRYQEKRPKVVTAIKVSDLDYPVDKINSNVWKEYATTEPNGQIRFNFNMGDKKQPAEVFYSIDFSEIETEVTITKKLTAFDKRVYVAVSELYKSGGITSVSQIYNALGKEGKAGVKDIQKINDSITKMHAAHIYLNNDMPNSPNTESKVHKRKVMKYDGSLLPMERMSAIINGQVTDSAIHIFREPPLMTFARDRGQITRIPRKLLAMPLSDTDANITIADYLLERIARMKNGKSKARRKILYSKICEKVEIKKASRDIPRIKDKVEKMLKHYQKSEYIKGYVILDDGVEIIL